MAKQLKLADYIGQQILLSGKSQIEIASDIGYDKPNVITMFKQGKTKVPINKIPALAKSIGVDPLHMLRLAMTEYMPETWEVIAAVTQVDNSFTENEQKIVSIIRNAAGGYDVAPETDDETMRLISAVESWRDRTTSRVNAALANSRQKLNDE